jgi:hypothetical protein
MIAYPVFHVVRKEENGFLLATTSKDCPSGCAIHADDAGTRESSIGRAIAVSNAFLDRSATSAIFDARPEETRISKGLGRGGRV